jgi:hypothetical protein
MRIPRHWKPLAISDLQSHLGRFTEWTLCGGYSIDLLLGRETRQHGDIDIGVFRSQLVTCLDAIGRDRVFLCQPGNRRVAWDGGSIDPAVHDLWISDRAGGYWCMQIMVFDDEGEEVFYRRDRRLHWQKSNHSITVGSLRILNPMITLLYKANKATMEEKEIADICSLIASGPKEALQRTAFGSDA